MPGVVIECQISALCVREGGHHRVGLLTKIHKGMIHILDWKSNFLAFLISISKKISSKALPNILTEIQ